ARRGGAGAHPGAVGQQPERRPRRAAVRAGRGGAREGGARLTSARTSSGHAPSQLQFDDNALLPLLFGEHDRHLARIEQQLGVSLTPRGNRLAIDGPAWSASAARSALSVLYERLKKG